MLKRGLPIALMALVLCACQSDPNAMDYSGNAHRQKECNRILAQLGVSGDNILDADVASTPERKKLVALYSAYGCDK
ncbi:MAG: hypothetical protein K0R48_1020 [Gammaproteobacteria bacterium]|nr:hypothetical protein [Gammaproteobacteria bacterium]